jgi:hypothetical protein
VVTRNSTGSARCSTFAHHDATPAAATHTTTTARPSRPDQRRRADQIDCTPTPASSSSGSSGCSTSHVKRSFAQE